MQQVTFTTTTTTTNPVVSGLEGAPTSHRAKREERKMLKHERKAMKEV
jgi:hypothetical protein